MDTGGLLHSSRLVLAWPLGPRPIRSPAKMLAAGPVGRSARSCHALAGPAVCVHGPVAWRRGPALAGSVLPLWRCVRAAAGVGAGLAVRAERSRVTAAARPREDELKATLEDMRKDAPILERYLDTALEPWPTDYLEMQPLMETDDTAESAVLALRNHLAEGSLREVDYTRRDLGGRCLVLATADVQGAGFVCGIGLAASAAAADELAAVQALGRLALPEDPVKEVLRCAEAVRTHEHHAGAREPAQHAGEALEGLAGRLRDARVAAFCPCGKAWMAAISAKVFHENSVLGSSADYVQEVALALAAEVFISRLRWALRVPPDEPHAPREWARTWQQRASAKDPWGGVHRRVRGQQLKLELGEEGEATLGALLDAGEDHYDRHARLSGAARRREPHALSPASAERMLQLDAEREGGRAKAWGSYAVAEQDARRPELVGKLPVEQIREGLSAALAEKQVVMVSGGTGSGKSTQLPQFLLDDRGGGHSGDGKAPLRVVVTQPRRIAAISVAERVAWERRQKLGDSVGYSVHGNAVRPESPAGTIEFVTVGTLLRRALNDPLLQNCDVVVVDEVHERDLLTDFLLILLREVLPRRPALRLLLMSATLDVDTFTKYFEGCPVLAVPAGPLHPVEEVHLDDAYFEEFPQAGTLLEREVAPATRDPGMDVDRRGPAQAAWSNGEAGDDSLLGLMEATVRRLAPELAKEKVPSAMLCFLPGWAEIRQLSERLQEGPDAKCMLTLPLHSTVPKEQQQRVFRPAPSGKVKVILGTNIAESSVTIDDVAVVVDSGLQRELTYDPKKRMSSLNTVWVSQSSAAQRRGRAGRVGPGSVYRLFSQKQLEALLPQPAPEMQRCDLAQSCLQAVALGRDPRSFLAEAPDPPSVAAVEAAMEELAAIDAIDPGDPPRLLPVGEVLARLPLEPLLGRAAMLGAILGVPDLAAAVLIVSAGRSPFSSSGSKEKLVAKQREFCSWSDPLAAAQALMTWEATCRKKGEAAATTWARKNLLSPSQLSSFSRAKSQLLSDMRRCGLLRGGGAGKPGARKGRDWSDEVDSAALLETWGDIQAEKEVDEGADGWLSGADGASINASVEPILVAILCSAYPTNLAVRQRASSESYSTRNVKAATMSPGSVNGNVGSQGGAPEGGDGDRSWWLYGELQQSSGRGGYLQSTTRVEQWQLAMFGGLRVNDIVADDPVIELDNWIGVSGRDPNATRLLRLLRREFQDAISWQALAALQRSPGEPSASALGRGAALLRAAVATLAGQEADPADMELVKTWKPGELPPAASTSGKGPKATAAAKRPKGAGTSKTPASSASQKRGASTSTSSGVGEPVPDLESMTIPQLKNILREKGLKLGGRKAELVERCAMALQESPVS